VSVNWPSEVPHRAHVLIYFSFPFLALRCIRLVATSEFGRWPHRGPTWSALTLVSIPVSGYAMRVRYIVAKKGLGPDVFQTRPPADFGGLKSA
jgi:hypothetical protein